jgi:hypothetical protein
LQAGSPAAASKENTEDQRKADEEKKLSGTVSSLSKWKVGGQTDVKRSELFVLLGVDFAVGVSMHLCSVTKKGSTKFVLCNNYLIY